MLAKVKNKTVFCLLLIVLFTSFCFERSTAVREQWIVPTFMEREGWYQKHTDVTAFHLSFVNNWLKEGPFNLRFGLFVYPASVEMSTLGQRGFYSSYPPGLILPVYLLFKALDVSGILPDIYDKRGMQLLVLTVYNYLMHFLLALTLCCFMFFICRKLGFDHLNSLLLSLTPTIVQFHNANSLYHHHAFYNMELAVMLPFALYILLEFLRTAYTSPRVLLAARVLQPLLVFYGILTDWFFIFVILTVYAIRLISKDIPLPVTLQHTRQWLKQSFLFFAPAAAAILLWMYQIAQYPQRVTGLVIEHVPLYQESIFSKLLWRMGIADGIDYYILYLKVAFISHLNSGYGWIGLLIIFATLYTATRGQKFMHGESNSIRQAAIVYLAFFAPCLVHNLFFLQHSSDHIYSSLKFSLALSFAFAFLPIFILQIARGDHSLPVLKNTDTRNISVAAVVALTSSLLFAYTQIHHKHQVTKMFSQPDYSYAKVGNFVQENTDYYDVVFSDFYFIVGRFDMTSLNMLRVHFAKKAVHFANNIDHIYYKTKHIEKDFSIKILYSKRNLQKTEQLISFLIRNDIAVDNIEQKKIGGMLSIDGKELRNWYEQVHECDVYPQRCGIES